MKRYKKRELKLSSLILIGAAAYPISVVLISFILAFVSSLTGDPTALVGAFSLIALLAGGLISSIVISKLGGEMGKTAAIISSAASAIIMISVGLILNGGRLPFGVFINMFAFIAVSVIGSILGKERIKKGRRRYA